MDKAFWKEMVVKPLLRRVGTWIAAFLVFGGNWACQHWNACGLVSESGAALVANYLAAVAVVCFDLIVSWAHSLSVARKARAQVLGK